MSVRFQGSGTNAPEGCSRHHRVTSRSLPALAAGALASHDNNPSIPLHEPEPIPNKQGARFVLECGELAPAVELTPAFDAARQFISAK
jgi:hypothetical protein